MCVGLFGAILRLPGVVETSYAKSIDYAKLGLKKKKKKDLM